MADKIRLILLKSKYNQFALEKDNLYILNARFRSYWMQKGFPNFNINNDISFWLNEIDEIDNQIEKWSADKHLIQTYKNFPIKED